MWLIRNSPRQEFERVWHTGLPADFDMPAVGKRLVRAHNDWTIRMAREHSTDRMRPVAILATDRLDQMMAELERLLDEGVRGFRSEEPTSELQSLMRTSYAVFCLKKQQSVYPNRHTNTLHSHRIHH